MRGWDKVAKRVGQYGVCIRIPKQGTDGKGGGSEVRVRVKSKSKSGEE
jgi:hypothetical protein